MSLSHRSSQRSLRRSFAVGAAGALVATLLPFSPAFAQQQQEGVDDPQVPQEDVCPPPGQTAEDTFPDDDASVHEDNIDCVAAYNIAQGFEDGTYRPGVDITRAQMATFIANFLDTAGVDLPAASEADDAFTDDENSVHEANINIVAELGVVQGRGGGEFDPQDDVDRAAMATFIANAIDVVDDGQVNNSIPPPGEDEFTDDEGSVHEDNINRLAGVGVVRGTGGTQFDPQESVIRAQMASFIMNAASYLHDIGLWLPTQAAQVTLTATAVAQGGQVEGEITAEGKDIQSVTVSGCGFDDEPVEDTDANEAGIQFSETLAEDQPAGECTLFFTVTFADGEQEVLRATITVEEAAVPAGGVTERPELVAADIVSTVTTAQATPQNPSGTTIRFTFDEAVNTATPNPALFHAYEFDGDVHNGDNARIDPNNNNAVLVRFTALDTQAEADELSVATVDPGAVRDVDGNNNPEGDDAVGSGQQGQLTAGRTDEPDLVSVGGFRQAATQGFTAVDFTFDENAFVQMQDGFHLVLDDDQNPEQNQDITCTGPAEDSTTASGQSVPGGEGTQTITVVCPNPGNRGNPITQDEVARAFVEQNTVNDEDTPADAGNPLQAVDLAGATDDPDLVSANLILRDAPTNDQILFDFDENVSVVACNQFEAFTSSAQVFQGNTCEQGNDESQVLVTFTADLSNVTGASVDDQAVRETDRDEPATDTSGRVDVNRNATNFPDEEAVQNQTQTNIAAGRTDGPDLIAVRLNQSTNAFGQAVFTATYTFDEDVSTTGIVSNEFFLYLNDGTRLICSDTAERGTTTDTEDEVTCEDYVVDTDNDGQIDAGEPAASESQEGRAVLGTVQDGAVDDEAAGTNLNPEGAERTSGGTGQPAQ